METRTRGRVEKGGQEEDLLLFGEPASRTEGPRNQEIVGLRNTMA